MPAVSKQQFKFFKALENDAELAKEHGMSTKEAAEYTKGNKGKYAFSKLKKRVGKKKS